MSRHLGPQFTQRLGNRKAAQTFCPNTQRVLRSFLDPCSSLLNGFPASSLTSKSSAQSHSPAPSYPEAQVHLLILHPKARVHQQLPLSYCSLGALPLPQFRPLGFSSCPCFCQEDPFQSFIVKPHRISTNSPPPSGSRSNVTTSKKPPEIPHM